jgi:glutaredoxin
VGISVDSRHCHANWAADLGGVSYPLLADFHEKGRVARLYGVYLEEQGFTDRATVIIDRQGVVRHASSVGPGGQRDIDQLLALAMEIDAAQAPPGDRKQERLALKKDATLYVREGCRFCQSVLRAMTNLHCEQQIRVRDVFRDPEARKELDRLAGAGAKVPALVQGGQVQFESAEIIKTLARSFARCQA